MFRPLLSIVGCLSVDDLMHLQTDGVSRWTARRLTAYCPSRSQALHFENKHAVAALVKRRESNSIQRVSLGAPTSVISNSAFLELLEDLEQVQVWIVCGVLLSTPQEGELV